MGTTEVDGSFYPFGKSEKTETQIVEGTFEPPEPVKTPEKTKVQVPETAARAKKDK